MTIKRTLRLGSIALAAGTAIGAGVWFGTASSGAASSTLAETGGPGPDLGVQERAGECINGANFDLGDASADSAKSPAEAFAWLQKFEPKVGSLTPAAPTSDNAQRAESLEAGRKVAAAEARPFVVESDKSTVWYVTQMAYSAPCDYVPQRDIDSANSPYPGITPGAPRSPDWRPDYKLAPPPDEQPGPR